MEETKKRGRKLNDPLRRIQVVLTQNQLDMVDMVSHHLGRNRSDVIREGIGEVLDRYSKYLVEVPK